MKIFKKQLSATLCLLLFVNTSIFAQLFPNPITLSTGQGLPGTLDPIWTCSQWYLTQPTNPSGATFNPALINNNCAPASWVNPSALPPPINNGNWITGQGANCAQNTTSGYRFFRLQLNLPPDCNGHSVTDPGNYSLTLTGYVDNLISDVFLNGNSLGISGGSFSAGNQLTITISGPWLVGINYIDILVYNSPNGNPNDPNPYGLLMVADANALDNNDTDNDGVSDLFDQCPCDSGNNAVGCLDISFNCDVDLIRNTFTNAGCEELEGCWDDCSMYFLNPQYLSGSGAQAFAQTLGSNLISIQSAAENECILSDLNRLGYSTEEVIWIGFNDETIEGQFEWYDESPVAYTNWAPGEPNNSGNEDCTQIYPGGGAPGTWNDLNCFSYSSMSIIEVNMCPITDVTPPITMCSGNDTTIEVTSTILGSFPYTYSWSNGSNQISQVVSPTQNTDYYVTTTDRYNCQAEDTVTVNINPTTNIDAGSNATICINDNTTLNATGGTTYNWDNGIGTGGSHTVSPTATTTYTVTGTDNNGCTNTDQVTVTVNPLPNVDVGSDFPICINDVTTLNPTGATSYTWDNGLGTGATQTISPNSTTTYTVTGTDNNGCVNSDQVIVTVNNLPNVIAHSDTTICRNGNATLSANGAMSYDWDNGLGTGSSHTFSPTATTTYIVTGTDNNGCINTDQVTVNVNPLPTATINGATEVCQDDTEPQVTFTGADGTAPYTFTYTIDGGTSQTVTSIGGNTATIDVPTSNSGTFTYDLVEVEDNSSTNCTNNQSGTVTITVNPLPTATINGSIEICQDDAEPQVTFTGATGTAPYIFTYTINGGASQTVATTTGNSVTVNAPTYAAGTFTYELVSVQDASSTTCSNLQTGTVTIAINPLPTATINGTTEVCQDGTAPQITFTGGNATPPYTFTYTINGGAQQTVTTTSGNTVTVNVPTNTVGTYIYDLVGVEDSSPANCSNKDLNNSATVIVNPLPTGTITVPDRICQYDAATAVFEGNNSSGDYIFTYNINSGSNQTTATNGGNETAVDIATNIPDILNYELTIVEDPASGCYNDMSQTVTVEVEAQPIANFHPDPSQLTSYEWESQMVNNTIHADSYYWDFGDDSDPSSIFSPTHEFPEGKTINYKVMLVASTSDGLCVDTAYQIVQFKNELLFYVPNTFTPNGDQNNNIFLPIFTAGYDPNDYTLMVFNRGGETIFESHDAGIGWDGTYHGRIVQDDTYIWKIVVQKTLTATREEFVGSVNLIR